MKSKISLLIAILLTFSFALVGCIGVDGKDGADGKNGIDGKDGVDGKSAYELYLEAYPNYDGTLNEWLASLKGADGQVGTAGNDGVDGKSAYELYLEAYPNYDGTLNEWLASLKGDQGEQGLQGEKGDKGDQGEQGLQGEKGEKGDKGDQGEQGLQGEKGDKGDKGDQGEKGDKGETGAKGEDGKDASGYFSQYVDVRDFGAQGDGVTDDTLAIRNARDEANEKGKILYFSEGTFLVSGSIQLFSNMHVIGNNATIIKKPAVTQLITADISAGDTVICVSDASAYTVGEDCYVGLPGNNNYGDTVAKITAIDTETNKITIESYKRHSNQGIARAVKVEAGGVFSNTFSIFTTFRYDDAGSNIIIEGVTLDGNRQSDEPYTYQLSPIHIDPTGFNVRVKDCNVKRGNADAISVQSNGNVVVEGCVIESAKQNGIHVGFTVESISISNNQVYNCYSGFYDCYDVNNLSIVGNTFSGCEYGCSGFDGESNGTVINGNNFYGCRYGVKTGAVAGMSITGNSFTGTKYFHIGIYSYKSGTATITGNTFNALANAIYVKSGSGISFNSNVIRNCTTPVLIDENTSSTGYQTTYCTFIGNIITATTSGKSANIVVKFGDHIIIRDNILTGYNASITVTDETAQNISIDGNIIILTT